jgi:hypothetical protein
MQQSVALQRYLQRHIEPGLPDCEQGVPRWQHVLVIPAYRESPELLKNLMRLPAGKGQTLVVLVLNRPATDSDESANSAIREAINNLDSSLRSPLTRTISNHTDLFLYDADALHGPLPSAEAVGLARKIGCDIALNWMHAGAISGDWICSSDADALLPPDYFEQLENTTSDAVALTFPFRHMPGPDETCNQATALYELRLHHYVLGLEYAGSPYAHHSLGSCLAVKAQPYAQVRGFPRRAGGEDFYLLNKLAKVGDIGQPGGDCIELQSRHSHRAPFGTGPAVAKIAAAADPQALPLFYHPQCFHALRALLLALPDLYQDEESDLCALLCERGLTEQLALASTQALKSMGLEQALQHCRRQGKSSQQFLRQFHQWFDAFRSLKFIHAVRDAGWPEQALVALQTLGPQIWPVQAGTPWSVEDLRRAVWRQKHWRAKPG